MRKSLIRLFTALILLCTFTLGACVETPSANPNGDAACTHTYQTTVTAPTDSKYGYTDYTCHLCGHQYQDDFVPATRYSEGLDYDISEDEKICTITGIGTCTDTEIVIPHEIQGYTVTAIDYIAFVFSDITSVTIPGCVTSIGGSAFAECSKLESVIICNGVESIIDFAFGACTSLKSIHIPSSVTSIGEGAFSGCTSLESMSVSPNNPSYYSTESCLIEVETKTLISAFNDYIIPADGSVTTIGTDAFRYGDLQSIIIPEGIVCIDEAAFYECPSVTSITIPSSVASIGTDAFGGCTELESITVDDNNPTYQSSGNCLIQKAEKKLLLGCKNSAIPDDGSVISIMNAAFMNCSDLTSITIPKSVKHIGIGAFQGCSSLTSVTFECTDGWWCSFNSAVDFTEDDLADPTKAAELLTSTYSFCYWYCADEANPIKLAYTENIENGTLVSYTVAGLGACRDADIVIPATHNGLPVVAIGNSAFSRVTTLSSIVIPDSITSIGKFAFEACSLESITMGKGITSIAMDAFSGCTELNALYITDIAAWCNIEFANRHANPILFAENFYLNEEPVTSIVIPDSVTHIYDYAFTDCVGLTEVTIGKNVANIDPYAFNNTNLSTITISPSNQTYHSQDNCIIETATKTLVFGTSFNSIPMDGSIAHIGDNAFCNWNAIGDLIIPNGVISIGEGAFSNCEYVISIEIPASVTSIGNYAFSCLNVTSIVVSPDNTVYHSEGNCLIETATKTLIAGCENSVIPADGSVTSIGNSAFRRCLATKIHIPDGVTSIGEYAFSNNHWLTSITLPNTLTSIGQSAFSFCENLTSITLPSTLTSIGQSAFLGCYGLTDVSFEVPNGWGAVDEYQTITLSENDLIDPAKAAEFLRSKYSFYTWTRN